MPKTSESLVILLVVLILGALIGTVAGEVIGSFVPGGVVEKIFSRGITTGLSPATLDLKIISLTAGFTVKINLASVFGIGLALLLYRRL